MAHASTAALHIPREPHIPRRADWTYQRLRQELAHEYAAPSWNEGRIDRLANEIVRVERAIAGSQPADEQTEDAVLGVLPAFRRSGSAWGDSSVEA